jgi:hypothetical protein
MNRYFAVAIGLLLSGCASVPDRGALPGDAKQVVDRLAACSHFAGEINGDRSARDKEVMAAMGRLRCQAIDSDVAATRKRYAGNPAVIQALDAAAGM